MSVYVMEPKFPTAIAVQHLLQISSFFSLCLSLKGNCDSYFIGCIWKAQHTVTSHTHTHMFIWFKVKYLIWDGRVTSLFKTFHTNVSWIIIKSFYDNFDAHTFQYYFAQTITKYSGTKKWHCVHHIQKWLI